MRYLELSHLLVRITVILFFLVGCTASAVTPVPSPSSTSTPIPPTTLPLTAIPMIPTPSELVSSREMLIGIWQPESGSSEAMFLQLNSDGTCRQSYSLEGLANIPEVECTYEFDGTNLSITAGKLNGVPECPSPTATYEVQFMGHNQMQLIPIQDSCAPRQRSTRGMYQRIP